jgi:hypothetical protein
MLLKSTLKARSITKKYFISTTAMPQLRFWMLKLMWLSQIITGNTVSKHKIINFNDLGHGFSQVTVPVRLLAQSIMVANLTTVNIIL